MTTKMFIGIFSLAIGLFLFYFDTEMADLFDFLAGLTLAMGVVFIAVETSKIYKSKKL